MKSNYFNAGLSKAKQSTATKDKTFSASKPESVVKNEPEEKSLKNFTEGVWIKKYPENYACFKFETPEGIKIITDPYMMDETVKPDIVTESHQHGDHTDVSKLQGTYKLIKEPGSYIEKGIKILGYSGKHNKGDVTGTNNIFVFEINGIKIAHFASQGQLPSDELLGKIGDADVLLIQASIKPEYANSKLNLEETEAIIKMLKPKIVIPEHGSENLGKALATYLDLKVEFVKNGEIVVTRSGLNASKGLRILDLDIDVPKN
jgi:hypothetical protein